MSFFSESDIVAVVYPTVIGEVTLTGTGGTGESVTLSPIQVADYDVYISEQQAGTMLVMLSTDGEMVMPETWVGGFDGRSVLSNDLFCNMSFESDDGLSTLTVSNAGFMFGARNATHVDISVHTISEGIVDAIGIALEY